MDPVRGLSANEPGPAHGARRLLPRAREQRRAHARRLRARFRRPSAGLRGFRRPHRERPVPRSALPAAARVPPLGLARPQWVDAPHFNAHYHVRHTALPEPAGEDELRRLAGRVFAQQLDRDKPLWEIWLVDTMADGRFALICKTHHALVDGISGVDIMTVLFDLSPDAEDLEGGPSWAPRPAPSTAELAAEAIAERVTSPLRFLRDVVAHPDRAGADAGRAAAGLAAFAS